VAFAKIAAVLGIPIPTKQIMPSRSVRAAAIAIISLLFQRIFSGSGADSERFISLIATCYAQLP
jgi:hypothetical protein